MASDKPTPIIASVTFDGRRHKVYVGTSLLLKYWNKKSQQALTRCYFHTDNSRSNDVQQFRPAVARPPAPPPEPTIWWQDGFV